MRSGLGRWVVGLATAAGLAVPMGVAGASPAAADSPQALVGTFRIAGGSCAGGAVSGSTFRMVLPSGNAGGPFVSNNDSACGDHPVTLLAPGTHGGLCHRAP